MKMLKPIGDAEKAMKANPKKGHFRSLEALAANTCGIDGASFRAMRELCREGTVVFLVDGEDLQAYLNIEGTINNACDAQERGEIEFIDLGEAGKGVESFDIPQDQEPEGGE